MRTLISLGLGSLVRVEFFYNQLSDSAQHCGTIAFLVSEAEVITIGPH
jgi:hypothetical protein